MERATLKGEAVEEERQEARWDRMTEKGASTFGFNSWMERGWKGEREGEREGRREG